MSVRRAAEKQTDVMGEFLEEVVEHLVADELTRRRGFRDKPLRALLPSHLGYAQEKISEGLREPASKPMALGGIDSSRGVVTKFRAAIECLHLRHRGTRQRARSTASRIENRANTGYRRDETA